MGRGQEFGGLFHQSSHHRRASLVGVFLGDMFVEQSIEAFSHVLKGV
jgi:hypothetical protein